MHVQEVHILFMFITRCTYAQQGYAFGCVGLYVYYVYIYIFVNKNRLFTALLLKNLPMSVFYYFPTE